MKGDGKAKIIVVSGEREACRSAAVAWAEAAISSGRTIAWAECSSSPSVPPAFRPVDPAKILWKSLREKEMAFEQAKRWISSQDVGLLVLSGFSDLPGKEGEDRKICRWFSDHREKKGFPNLVITGGKGLACLPTLGSDEKNVLQIVDPDPKKTEKVLSELTL